MRGSQLFFYQLDLQLLSHVFPGLGFALLALASYFGSEEMNVTDSMDRPPIDTFDEWSPTIEKPASVDEPIEESVCLSNQPCASVAVESPSSSSLLRIAFFTIIALGFTASYLWWRQADFSDVRQRDDTIGQDVDSGYDSDEENEDTDVEAEQSTEATASQSRGSSENLFVHGNARHDGEQEVAQVETSEVLAQNGDSPVFIHHRDAPRWLQEEGSSHGSDHSSDLVLSHAHVETSGDSIEAATHSSRHPTVESVFDHSFNDTPLKGIVARGSVPSILTQGEGAAGLFSQPGEKLSPSLVADHPAPPSTSPKAMNAQKPFSLCSQTTPSCCVM